MCPQRTDGPNSRLHLFPSPACGRGWVRASPRGASTRSPSPNPLPQSGRGEEPEPKRISLPGRTPAPPDGVSLRLCVTPKELRCLRPPADARCRPSRQQSRLRPPAGVARPPLLRPCDPTSPIRCSPASNGASSARSAAAGARWPPAFRISRTRSTSAPPAVASGKRTAPARHGNPCSNGLTDPRRSAPSRSRRRSENHSTSAPAIPSRATTSPPATAYTNRPTAASTGSTSGCRRRATSAQILIDPHDANTVLVGALGHIFGPSPDRGVFRTTDGGGRWTKTLFVDNQTGVVDLAADPADPNIVFATRGQRATGHGSAISRRSKARAARSTKSHRRRRDVETSERRRLAARASSAASALAVAHLARTTRRASMPRSIPKSTAASIAPTMPARTGNASTTRQRRHHLVREPPHRRAERSRHGLHGRPVDPPIDRRRQDLHDLQGRARRRRLPLRLDQPEAPEPHDHRERPGHGRHRRRRRALERLVQPADRSVLPSRHRQPLPVLDLFRPAGFRHRRHRQPQRLRRDLVSRLASRSAATSATTTFPIRKIRTSSTVRALARASRAGTRARAKCRTSRRGRCPHTAQRPTDSQIPLHVDLADRVLRARAVRALRRHADAVPLERQRPALGHHQPRPDRQAGRREALRRRRARSRTRPRAATASSTRSRRRRAATTKSGSAPTTA